MSGKRYSQEFKERALKLSDEIGIQKAAKQLNITEKTMTYFRYARNKIEKEQQKKQIEKEKNKLSHAIKPLNPSEELKENKFITFKGNNQKDIKPKRGEIYYVTLKPSIGNEIISGRPAVVVSNNNINDKYETVEIIYLTTKVKPLAPEFVIIKSSGKISTVVGNQITTVDISRLREYLGVCTPEEMNKIERAMLFSLGLEKSVEPSITAQQALTCLGQVTAERDAYKEIYDKLLERYFDGRKK